MQPSEFFNCTYKEAYQYAEANIKAETERYKKDIVLYDALGNKIISAICSRHPKRINLVTDVFNNLFEEEINSTPKTQTIEEQIRNLRSRK